MADLTGTDDIDLRPLFESLNPREIRQFLQVVGPSTAIKLL